MGLAVMSPPPAHKNGARSRPPSLDAGARAIEIRAGAVRLKGTLTWPCHPSGFVLFARDGGKHAGLQDERLAIQLRADGLGTLLLDRPLGHRAYDLELQAGRILVAMEWLAGQPEAAGLPLGCLGIGFGAVAALVAAGSFPLIGAVVSCGGRPDLLSERLSVVRPPTLLIVGERDEDCLRLSHPALVCLGGPSWQTTIPGAGPRFEEAGALEEAGRRAAQWFVRHLVMEPAWRAAHPGHFGLSQPAPGHLAQGFGDRPSRDAPTK